MNMNLKLSQILGLGTLAIGVVLVLLAWQGSNAPVDQISDALTGRYTDRTILILLLGIGALLTGAIVGMSGQRKA